MILNLLNCLDHFPVDPATSPVNATGQQLVTLCRSICAEERAQILDQLLGNMYLTSYLIISIVFLSSLYFLVHRIRCRSPPFGTGYYTLWSTSCQHKWHQRRRFRSESSTSKYAFKAHIQNERKCGRQMRWVGSLSLGLPIQLANRAISILGSAARMFQCWPTDHKKF